MPIYSDLPIFEYYPRKELAIRELVEPLGINSLLDVGAGHGGVFDYGYWDGRKMERREACDMFWIRPMSERWATKTGVDACKLTDHYAEKSFDLVFCMEVLEHIPENRKALEQLCKVARKAVVITSADEMHHRGEEQEAIEKVNAFQKFTGQPKVKDMEELGFTVNVDNYNQRQLIAWRFL